MVLEFDDAAAGEKAATISSVSDFFVHFGSSNASKSRAFVTSYRSSPAAFRLANPAQNVFPCWAACKVETFQLLSKLVLGIWARKKMSSGFVANAKRWRMIFLGGKS